MNTFLKSGLLAFCVLATLSLNAAAEDESEEAPVRMANGVVIEGAVQEATADGLVIKGEKETYTAPWKYLSAGTRYRYERPMLAALEAARSNELQKAVAAAARKEAAEKAAAAKAAAAQAAAAQAAATNAAGTNATGVVSNTPAAKK